MPFDIKHLGFMPQTPVWDITVVETTHLPGLLPCPRGGVLPVLLFVGLRGTGCLKARRDFATLGLLHPRYQKAEQNVCVTFTPDHCYPRSLFQFQIIKRKVL